MGDWAAKLLMSFKLDTDGQPVHVVLVLISITLVE